MGGCTPDIIPQLKRKYGNQLLEWVQAEVGGKMITQQFGGVKSQIENLFNEGEFDQDKMSLFDQVIAKVNDEEAKEVNDITKDKPSIPELDKLAPKQKNVFIDKAQEFFQGPLSVFKDTLQNKMTDSGVLDAKKWIPSL